LPSNWLSWARSNDKLILGSLEKQGSILVEATSLLVELLSDYEKSLSENKAKIKELEVKGDNITHEFFITLSQTFITPLDREDLSGLTITLDQVLDCVDGTADRFVLFKIEKPIPYMLEFANLLHLSSKEIHSSLIKLHTSKKNGDLIEHCRKIKKYEHEADNIYRKAISELFEVNDAVHIVKNYEIYQILESSIDRCMDLADIVEDIVLKYG
jgi:predicted phosphate transport protein (TIGR00153 family)